MLKGELKQQMDVKWESLSNRWILKEELKQQMDVKGRAKATDGC
jgi:hypothetical protein